MIYLEYRLYNILGAVPLSVADALILSPLEAAEVNAIAKIYGIKNDESTKKLFNTIVEVGTVSMAAKGMIAALKNIPGINLGASVINAVIAASMIIALGEGTIYIFEQIYLGKKTVSDIDWVTKFLESKLSLEFVEKVKSALPDTDGNFNAKEVIKKIVKF